MPSCCQVYKLTAIVHKEDDMYIAECLELHTISQGFTIKEAVNNLSEATELYLEEVDSTEINSSNIQFKIVMNA